MGIAIAQKEFHWICMERAQGRWPEASDVALFGTPLPSATAVPVPSSLPVLPPGLELGTAIHEFLDEKERRGELKSKRRMDFKAALGLLVRRVDSSTAVNHVSASDIGSLRTLLTKLPSNFTKLYRKRDFDEVIAETAAKGLPLLSTDTINQKYLGLIEQFFEWCLSCGHIKENPANGIRIKVSARASGKNKRGTFSAPELNVIFRAPLFIGCKSDGRIYEPGTYRVGDYRYWLPLLGLFTGARLNELCQLHSADISEFDRVPCVDISPLPGVKSVKSVKSEAGQRKVPVHPELIRLGFLHFAKRQKESGYTRLFPELEKGKSGYYSDNASKWFRRFLRETLGTETVKDRRLVFHSFRHVMKDALREAAVDERIQDALIGHENDHVSATYGEGYKPPRLLEEISKVTFKDLDLSHLYPSCD